MKHEHEAIHRDEVCSCGARRRAPVAPGFEARLRATIQALDEHRARYPECEAELEAAVWRALQPQRPELRLLRGGRDDG